MTEGSRRLRWGIIGCGLISSDMVKAIQLLPHNEHEITAVAASSLERAKAFALDHNLGNASAYGDYDQLYSDPNVEVVYIGLLNHQHKAAVLKALDGGKHVLCEKPMALNVKETRAMIDKAREKNLFLMEAFWSRFFPVWKEIKSELQQNAIGNVSLIQSDFGFIKPDSEINPRILHLDKGGGLAVDICCYQVQFSLFVFGMERPEKISAIGWQRGNFGVDDTASVTLKFSGNRMAQLLYTGSSDTPGQAQVFGTTGRLQIPDHFWCPDTLIKHTKNPEPSSETKHFPVPAGNFKFQYTNSGGLSYQAAAVRECIVKGKTECPVMPLDESLIIAEVLQEIRRQLGVKYAQDDD